MPSLSPDLLDVIDLARRLANLLRLGTIEQVDHPAARVRVRSGDIVTTWLPWFTWRAGAPQLERAHRRGASAYPRSIRLIIF